jgi:outer membrane receptor protein involved in Fe transport
LLLPGVRADYFQRVHQSIAEPRITARYQIRERFTLKGGVGLFAQEPTFDETDPVFGNPALKAEQAIHYSVGAEYKPRPYVTLDATLFYKSMTNLVSRTSATTPDSSGAPRALLYDNNGRGRAYGVELVARHEIAHNFTGWLAYTLMRSERLDSGATSYRLFDYDQTHILTLMGGYKLGRGWDLGGTFRLVSGNPRTPITGSVYDANSDFYNPIYGAVNSARDPAFHQLAVRVEKAWKFKAWQLASYLDVQNVYNHRSQEGLQYSYDYSRSKPVLGLPILPSLGVRGEF